jgi:hypothetical protein
MARRQHRTNLGHQLRDDATHGEDPASQNQDSHSDEIAVT